MITYVLVGGGIAIAGFLVGTLNAWVAVKSAEKKDK